MRIKFIHEQSLPYEELERRIKAYNPDTDFSLFSKAFHLSKKAHEGQKRSSGEDYFIHPCNVTAILIKLRLDMDSLIAGLLHDVIEDCGITPEELKKDFSPTIADIVLGMTKISKIKFKTQEESQAENFRKMIIAMAKDIRVIIVKLADRMHNMQTLQYISNKRQKKIARETLDIYVPLSNRLGIYSVKTTLENLCLKFLHPELHQRLKEKTSIKKNQRDIYIKEAIDTIHEKLLEYSVKADISGTMKHLYSLFKKMNSGGMDFDQIQDILVFKIIVSNITECYKTLGIIHSHFRPIPGRFKDYIAISKINGYQGIHTSVIGPKAERLEIHIQTHEMEEIAEVGIAASWRYKEGINSLVVNSNFEWIQGLLEFSKNVSNNNEFMYAIKSDLDIEEVFVFTPKGDVKELTYGATPLDFAYAIHTDVGHSMVGAKVNGKIVHSQYILKSGDTVEILTNEKQTPSQEWLNIVKTAKAKTRINQWLIKTQKEEGRTIGETIFREILVILNTTPEEFKDSKYFEKILNKTSSSDEDDFYINIGSGKANIKTVVKMLPYHQTRGDGVEGELQDINEKIESITKALFLSSKKKFKKGNPIIVNDGQGLRTRTAKCCNPIPGDPLVGYMKKDKTVAVHISSCRKVRFSETIKIVNVEWNPEDHSKHSVNIKVTAHDKPGILSIISKEINKTGVNIRSAVARSTPDQKGDFVFEVEISDYYELLKVMGAVESLPDVISAMRS